MFLVLIIIMKVCVSVAVGVHSSDILISCSPPLTPSNEHLFISLTGALLNNTSLCSLRPIATHAQSLDKRKQQIEGSTSSL